MPLCPSSRVGLLRTLATVLGLAVVVWLSTFDRMVMSIWNTKSLPLVTASLSTADNIGQGDVARASPTAVTRERDVPVAWQYRLSESVDALERARHELWYLQQMLNEELEKALQAEHSRFNDTDGTNWWAQTKADDASRIRNSSNDPLLPQNE